MHKKYRQALTLLSIDPDDLEDDFGKATVNRGIAYFEAGYVLTMAEPQALRGSELDRFVTGTVDGSYSEPYSTTLRIEYALPGDAIVSSQCSCPVGYGCKHGIALLFQMLKTLPQETGYQPGLAFEDAQSDEENIDSWLHVIQQSEQDAASHASNHLSPPTDEPYHAIYLLDFSQPRHQGEKAGLNVRLVKARALKKGGYGQVYSLDTHELSDEYRYYSANCYKNELDSEIAPALSALPKTGYGPSQRFFLHGEIGQLVFNKILLTGRSFWKNHKSLPLSIGDSRTLELKWVVEGKAYRSSVECTPHADMLFALNDLYYFDEKCNQCGLAAHESLTSEQLLMFANAPVIPKKIAKEVSLKMAQALPDINYPLPAKIKLKQVEVRDINPVFYLRLQAMPRTPMQVEGQTPLIHIASLSFKYADIDIQPATAIDLARSVTTIFDGKTRYRIYRQNTQEQQAIEHLANTGFVPAQIEPFRLLDWVLPAITLEESVLAWDEFLVNTVPELEAQGWVIEIDDSFSLAIDIVDDWHAELEEMEGGDWFEMNLGFELNGKSVNLLPLLVTLLAQNPDKEALHESLAQKEHQLLQIDDVQWVKVPAARVQQILDTIIELYDTDALTQDGNFAFPKLAGLNFNALLNDPQLRWKGADELQLLNQKIRDFSGIETIALPKELKVELRDYQRQGLNWLQFLRSYQFNGILADDMGLGKTVQALANLLIEKENGRADLPSLVIAPTSLMSNWKNEALKFTPDLRVLILQGTDRKQKFSLISEHDVILTTYPLMMRDKAVFEEQEFHYLILDEAQAIKNAKAKTTQIIYKLKARHRLCVTGTPMENHLGEIWSMYHFLMPGYLGTHARFNRLFRTPIEKHGDDVRGQQLRNRIEPFLLRRTKDVVAQELPEKTEIIRTVPLSGKQRDLYETVRIAMDKKVRDEIGKKGLARSHIMILDALLKLRQVCCDPQLVRLEKARKVKESAKLEMLMDMVPEMVEEGRKILIFSQFTSMLSIIEAQLKQQNITFSKLTGQTRKRPEAIAAFQEGNASVFLISLKAGGTGLNLTAADTVIHYDPWWNPAVEKQATDRAHRIGQDKPVFVYKLLTEETVEEKILKMQAKKQALADSLYGNKARQQAGFDQNDLIELLKPLD